MIPQNTMGPAGPGAGEIASLSWIVYIIFAAVVLGMWILIGWIALRRRGTLDEHAPVDLNDGHEWILTGGFAIPFCILATVFILGLRTMSAFPIADHGMPTPQIIVTGHQWWWEVEYVGGGPDQHFKTANEIHIPAGKPVDIELMSYDVIHSFWVPKLNGKVDLIPGQPNVVRIQANEPGDYRGQCAEFCGEQHAHMFFHVIAQRPVEYEAWVREQLAPAADPVDDQQKAGQQQFMGQACSLCHAIRGTDAHGVLGPDLTHLASRQGIASDMLANNEANLSAWVTHAQSLKPGAVMPNVTAFTGVQLKQLVAYLKSLH
jgi:cytochrome c oxidase subunit 2